MKKAREDGLDVASDEAIAILEERTTYELERMHTFFGAGSPLLRVTGRVILYFHIFRLCTNAGIQLPMSLYMLEKFNTDVTRCQTKVATYVSGFDRNLK